MKFQCTSSIDRLALSLLFICLVHVSFAQTFTATPNVLIELEEDCVFGPDFQIDLSNEDLAPLEGAVYGLVQVCWEATHSWVDDLDVYLRAPDSTLIELSTDNGANGDNYTNTCVQMDGMDGLIPLASPPYTGQFIPQENLYECNNGQDPNGKWTLEICDDAIGFQGTLVSWSITFGNPVDDAFALADSFGLVEFYNWHGGDNWLDNEGWLQPGVPIKDWKGIGLNSENAVSSIHLPVNNLTGTLYPRIDFIQNLQTLNLADNDINGLLNVNLLQLEYLDTLILTNNATLADTFPELFAPLCDLDSVNFDNTGLESFEDFCAPFNFDPGPFWSGDSVAVWEMGGQDYFVVVVGFDSDSIEINGSIAKRISAVDHNCHNWDSDYDIYTYNINGEVFLYDLSADAHYPFVNFDAEVGDTFDYHWFQPVYNNEEIFEQFVVDSIGYEDFEMFYGGAVSVMTQYVHGLLNTVLTENRTIKVFEGIGYDFGFFPTETQFCSDVDDRLCSFGNQIDGSVVFTPIDCVVSNINEIEAQKFSIYPNPADQFINIEFSITQKNATIKLYNSAGVEIEMLQLEEANKSILDISNYSAGIYFLEVLDENMNMLGVERVVITE